MVSNELNAFIIILCDDSMKVRILDWIEMMRDNWIENKEWIMQFSVFTLPCT